MILLWLNHATAQACFGCRIVRRHFKLKSNANKTLVKNGARAEQNLLFINRSDCISVIWFGAQPYIDSYSYLLCYQHFSRSARFNRIFHGY